MSRGLHTEELAGSFSDNKVVKENANRVEKQQVEVEPVGLNSEVKFTLCGGKYKVTEKLYLLVLFGLINMFLFADQNLLAPNLSVIADEFGMSEDERDQYLGGYISLGFFLIGGIIALIVGYLADTMNRKYIFSVTIMIGEISCAGTYWVPTESKTDFWKGLWLCRSITGFALGGALPIQFSLLGDMFTEADRGKAVALMAIAATLGFSLGQYLANYLSPDWRSPFLIVSIPSFALVALFLLTTTEPKRGQAEALLQGARKDVVDEEHKITWDKVKLLTKNKTALLVIGQGIFGTLPWGTVGVYVNDFLKEEKMQSNASAANAMLLFGIAQGVSTWFGGLLVDKYSEKHPKYLPLIAGATTAVSPALMIWILRAPPMNTAFYCMLLIPTALVAGIAGPIVKGLLLQVTIPEIRGTAFACQTLMDELGKGLGPFLIAAIIAASSTREDGLTIGILGWIPCGFVMLSIWFFLDEDIARYKLALAAAYNIELTAGELEQIPVRSRASLGVAEAQDESHSV